MPWRAAATTVHRHLLILSPDCPSNPWWWVTVQPCKPGNPTPRAGEISLPVSQPTRNLWLAFNKTCRLPPLCAAIRVSAGTRRKTVEAYCWGGQHHRSSGQLKLSQAHTRRDLREWNPRACMKAPLYLFWENNLENTFFLIISVVFLVSLPFPFSSSVTLIWWKKETRYVWENDICIKDADNGQKNSHTAAAPKPWQKWLLVYNCLSNYRGF